MTNKGRAFGGLLLAVWVLAAFAPQRLRAEPNKKRTVVVISLDGFPAYAFDDPRLPTPTLRKLAREGVIAAGMRPVNPTVTWPNHTAMVTGVDGSRHQVLYNGMLTHPAGKVAPVVEAWRDKEMMVHAPTVYDLAFNAGLTTAQVDWVAIYGAKTITWKFPEIPDPKGAIEQELIADGTATEDQLRTFEDGSQVWQDEIWTAAARKILEKHKPNLLLFHLLTLDSMNHQYAPLSGGSFTAMAFLDAKVKQILESIERAKLTKQTTVLIVSDHGFRSIKHVAHANILLRQNGLLAGSAKEPTGDAWVMPEGGSALVYVKDPNRRAELVPKLRQIFSGAEGVDRVYTTEELPQLGLPTPATSDQAPDLVLAASADYAFGGDSEGEYVTHVAVGGSHGYVNSDPKMQAIFLAWGAGVPQGVRLDSIANVDIAPTVAALLGLKMEHIQGKPIEPIVNSEKPKTAAH
jgi:predicted AlkP superfamily pyrophosphatase or phosphodiesterase